MNTYHLNWLQGELKKWESSEVVSPDVSEKIKNYYKEQEEKEKILLAKHLEEENLKKAELAKKLPVIFSAIAAFLISAGVISLIAFNWHVISRDIKTCGAFIMALAPGFAYYLCSRNEKGISRGIREFISLLWGLLTGGMIEFIIQIHKIPSPTEVTFILWLAVAILILFATETTGSFFLSVVLLISTVLSSVFSQILSPAVFYPLMMVLFFAARKDRLKCHVLTGTYFLLLGFVLEKCLPGLWITSYMCSLSVLFFIAHKKNERFLVSSSLSGIFILLVLLCFNFVWKDIGWNFFRNDADHNPAIAVLDYVIAGILFLASVALPVLDAIKEKRIEMQHSVAVLPVATAVFYIMCSMNHGLSDYSLLFIYGVLSIYAVGGAILLKDSAYYLVPGFLAVIGFFCTMENSLYYLVSVTALLWTISDLRKNRFSEPSKWYVPLASVLTVAAYVLFLCQLHGSKIDEDDLIPFVFVLSVNVSAICALCAFDFRYLRLQDARNKFMEILPLAAINVLVVVIGAMNCLIDKYQNEIFGFAMVAIASYSFVAWRKTGRAIYLTIPAILFVHVLGALENCGLHHGIMVCFIICSLANYGILNWRKESKSPFRIGSLALFMSIMLVPVGYDDTPSWTKGDSTAMTVFVAISMVWFAAASIFYPMYLFKKDRKLPQVGINLWGVKTFVFMALKLFSVRVDVPVLYEIIFYVIIFIFVVQEIFLAYREMSLKKVNIFAVYFFVILLKHFFMQPTSLVARGLVFIISGVVVMAVNMTFSKKLKEKESLKNEN